MFYLWEGWYCHVDSTTPQDEEENLTFDPINNNVTYIENVTQLMVLFQGVMAAYQEESENYDEIQDDLDDYEFFDEIR